MIDLAAAKRHLRVDHTAEDAHITLLLAAATTLVLDRAPDITGPVLDAAVLLVVADLFEHRDATSANPLSPAVENLLRYYRRPALA
ncbi:MAG: head-tail connector protein [Rhodocyclaceae bacterium]|nr:head-tail connector protein [Rhodocyclaceae bacterium]MCP5234794.1 phage gp6-like head-tail connector protein [Zoogloeaceae bacterium]